MIILSIVDELAKADQKANALKDKFLKEKARIVERQEYERLKKKFG